MAKSVIFDIDGTLADARNRLHHILGQKKDWDAFFIEAEHDPLHVPICDLALLLADAGVNIIVVSGRPERIRLLTESWLAKHGVIYSELHSGWRAALPIDLLAKHAQIFGSQLKDILAGDGQPNVTVIDLRRTA